ncbi:MAG: spore protease YyaC [Paenibacillus sp.]|uniref:spore protease YyaC n=1 Tax=Paenibacillus sp. TaxID=58172 RepID=UPI0025D0AC95|nr:spore protease YyaC [Paenibacillus sp.]MBR2563369.1 spore protease YyaC [Paenibacillus sp.]
MALYKRELVRQQNRGRRKAVPGDHLSPFFKDISQLHSLDQITFLCIGTDRSTGDALGPMTGTLLEERGIPHVIGTLAAPCDADTLEKRLAHIPAHHTIIAIDACLGPKDATGTYYISGTALRPAQSVGGNLPEVGEYSVAAVVNANGPRPYSILQMTSLYLIMGMSRTIADAISEAWDSGNVSFMS